MSKVKKKLQRHADEIMGESSPFGGNYVDYVINTKKRRITFSGPMPGLGDAFMTYDFNKKCSKPKRYTTGVDYDAYNGRYEQTVIYQNFNKYEKAIYGDYGKRYSTALSLINNLETVQKGVDLYERIPGIQDVDISLFNYDASEFSNWT